MATKKPKLDPKLTKLQVEYSRIHHNLMFLILDKDWQPAHDTLNELIACDAKIKSRRAELIREQGQA